MQGQVLNPREDAGGPHAGKAVAGVEPLAILVCYHRRKKYHSMFIGEHRHQDLSKLEEKCPQVPSLQYHLEMGALKLVMSIASESIRRCHEILIASGLWGFTVLHFLMNKEYFIRGKAPKMPFCFDMS